VNPLAAAARGPYSQQLIFSPNQWDRSFPVTQDGSRSTDLRERISEGILAFPATAFTAAGALDEPRFAAHIAELAAHAPAALVPAGGAGELFSLSLEEQRRVVAAAVAAAGAVPVIAGAGQGLASACAMAEAAERAGAAGVLLFPPYLVQPEQAGLAAYVARVCAAVSIPVVVYSRDNGVLEPDTALRLADACPNLVAVKDGTADFEALTILMRRAGDRLTVVNGVPTAEIVARQYFAAGVTSYSSAVFTFLPAVARRFYGALRDGDAATVDRLLDAFYLPLATLRRRRRGYAVAIVKAGLRVTGRPAGPVRPPLVDLTDAETGELARLVERAVAITREAPAVAAAAG
jgi:5-dehydro-4-deoxyglucarate dehydratase